VIPITNLNSERSGRVLPFSKTLFCRNEIYYVLFVINLVYLTVSFCITIQLPHCLKEIVKCSDLQDNDFEIDLNLVPTILMMMMMILLNRKKDAIKPMIFHYVYRKFVYMFQSTGTICR